MTQAKTKQRPAAVEQAPGVLVYVDPATLLVDRNVRQDDQIDPAFIESISEQGVLVPITAVRVEGGALRVRTGHRRTRAAVAAGRKQVPVVVQGEDSDEPTATVDRLVGQWSENDHRRPLTLAEEVAVVEQLTAFGLDEKTIARRIKAPTAKIAAAATVARSEVARAATLEHHDLTLVQLAALAEFEQDPEAVARLVRAAAKGAFEVEIERIRLDRAEEQARQWLTDQLTAQGVLLIEEPVRDHYGRYEGQVRRLKDLSTAAASGARRPALTVAEHVGCPGHAAYLTKDYGYITESRGLYRPDSPADSDDTAGEEIQARSVYAADELEDEPYDDEEPYNDDEEDQPAKGEYGYHLQVDYACTDPKQYGHAPRSDDTQQKQKLADLSPEEADKVRAQRKDVITSNKDWRAVERVRSTWVRETITTRKTPPKGSAAFMATALALDTDVLNDLVGNHLAAKWLGCKVSGYGRSSEITKLIEQASDARAQVIALTLILAAYEAKTTDNDWRRPSEHTIRYLTFLADCGYERINVERRACRLDPVPDDKDGTSIT